MKLAELIMLAKSANFVPHCRSCKNNIRERMKSYYMLKTEDIHPLKTGISVHFSCSLVCHKPHPTNVLTFLFGIFVLTFRLCSDWQHV